MKVAGEVVLITGAGGGIGQALAREAKARGAAALVLSDLAGPGLEEIAAETGGIAVAGDLRDAGFITRLVAEAEERAGPVGILCCNAGTAAGWVEEGVITAPSDAVWALAWEVNVLSHVRLSRAVLPGMIARGRGHLLQTISAAGLLTAPGAATYSATKHAALGLAESLAIAHGPDGIGVTALCPQGVDTAMLADVKDEATRADGVMSAGDVARLGFDGVEAGQFLVTPHQRVRRYMAKKASDYEAWIAAMQGYTLRNRG